MKIEQDAIRAMIVTFPTSRLGKVDLPALAESVCKELQAHNRREDIAAAYAKGDMYEAARLSNENPAT